MKSRTPIVMIHGAFCGGWAFDKFRAPFERRFATVLTPTLRHHDPGKEPSPALATTSLTDYVGDLEAALAVLERPPVLIGHSMGGLLAQMVAARMPVRAAILLAPCAPWGVLPSTVFEVASAQALFWAGDFWNVVLQPSFHVATANSLDKLSPAEQSAMFARFVPESGLATFEIMQWAFDIRRAAHVPEREVTCPILCLAGSEDRMNPPSTVETVARRYRGRVIYEELKGHSHWLVGEPGWERIADRALAWLDEVLADDDASAPAVR